MLGSINSRWDHFIKFEKSASRINSPIGVSKMRVEMRVWQLMSLIQGLVELMRRRIFSSALIRPLSRGFGEFQERCTWRTHCVFFLLADCTCVGPAAHSFLLNERSLCACAIILLIHRDYTEKALKALRLLLYIIFASCTTTLSTDHMLACLSKSLFFRVICSAITRSALVSACSKERS